MATIIICDKCGKIANSGKFSSNPPTICANRGSNIIVGGGINSELWNLCDSCFENILLLITISINNKE